MFRTHSGYAPAWHLVVAVLTYTLASCSDAPVAPATYASTSAGAVKFWESNAALFWNDVARGMVTVNRSAPPFAIRGYAIVSVAQYNAAVAAENGRVRNVHPSVRAAIAGASAEALAYLYPGQAATLQDVLEDFLSSSSWPGEKHTDAAAGEAIGRAVAEQVIGRAQSDGFFAPASVTVPVGPGLWFSSTPPVGAGWGRARTYFLESPAQFRPPPPPAFDSPEFAAALQEVLQISESRTTEQEANARFWDFPPGTYTPPGYWNEAGARLAVRYHLKDREAAHVFALINMVAYDAIVASHEAKFFYWLIRPSQADPRITVPIVLPNFPSYPSNHAAISAGMARILGAMFPAERSRLDALADEAALSRVLGGIHYRFDGEAGLALGRQIAAWALDHDVVGHQPFVLR